jgi:uncharacterized spore protein YtfJ
VGSAVTEGIGVGVGEGVGSGEAETEDAGVGEGVATGIGAACFTSLPLLQTSFLPLFLQVKTLPLYV